MSFAAACMVLLTAVGSPGGANSAEEGPWYQLTPRAPAGHPDEGLGWPIRRAALAKIRDRGGRVAWAKRGEDPRPDPTHRVDIQIVAETDYVFARRHAVDIDIDGKSQRVDLVFPSISNVVMVVVGCATFGTAICWGPLASLFLFCGEGCSVDKAGWAVLGAFLLGIGISGELTQKARRATLAWERELFFLPSVDEVLERNLPARSQRF